MAAALHAKILSGAHLKPGRFEALRAAAMAAAVDLTPIVVAPQRFAAPRPQHTAACFAGIVHWREEDDPPHKPAEPEGTGYEKYGYLRSGGKWEQRVLAVSRYCVEYNRSLLCAQAMADPARANEAAPWPPQPTLTVGQPIGGGDAPQPQQPSPIVAVKDKSEIVTTGRSTPQLTTAMTTMGPTPPSLDLDGNTKGHANAPRAARPGFFIGSDGIEWPLPPPECRSISSSSVIPPLPLTAHNGAALEVFGVLDVIPPLVSDDDEVIDRPLIASSSTSSTNSMLPRTPGDGDSPVIGPSSRCAPAGAIGDGRPGAIGQGRPRASSGSSEAYAASSTLFCAAAPAVNGWGNVKVSGGTRPQFFAGRDISLWPLPPT